MILAYCCRVATCTNRCMVSFYHLVSRGKKSKLLFRSGKRRAEALMTSVGFGVTRPRTCCFRKTIKHQYKQQTITLQNKSTFWVVVPMASNCPEQKQDVHIFLQSCAHLSCSTGNMFTSQQATRFNRGSFF